MRISNVPIFTAFSALSQLISKLLNMKCIKNYQFSIPQSLIAQLYYKQITAQLNVKKNSLRHFVLAFLYSALLHLAMGENPSELL